MSGGKQHGTYSRYQLERRAGLKPCGPCTAAQREYMRNWRASKRPMRCVGGLGWPETAGSSITNPSKYPR